MEADFTVEDHGSIFLVQPLSDRALAWLEENLRGETQWFGRALAVEPRYLNALVEGMLDEGLAQLDD